MMHDPDNSRGFEAALPSGLNAFSVTFVRLYGTLLGTVLAGEPLTPGGAGT